MTAVYLHIPFCDHICFYCDFNKVFLEGQPVDEYIELVIKEMELSRQKYPQERATSFYVGGGTPTTLSVQQLDRLLNGIHTYYPLSPDAEFTVEANPESVSLEKFRVMKEYGVNRISMGVQSFNNRILKKIGRIHTAEQVYDCIAAARKANFENISIDLIFRLPQQTLADFQTSLMQALELDLPHYSVYSLILENKTIFYNLMRQGKLPLPSEDEEADMYELVMQTMQSAGRKQYEISNYALPGFESQHNLAYWQNKTYFGFGAGAHGYIKGSRYQNHGPIQHYLEPLRQKRLPIIQEHVLSEREKIEEEMILGLRTMAGIDRSQFQLKYGFPVESYYAEELANLMSKGLISCQNNHYQLTHQGKFLGNEVFRAFLFT